jgi:hypothetical protein
MNPTDEFKYARFETELATLINCHSMENLSDTPDFILAAYLTSCLKAFNEGVGHRQDWHQPPSSPREFVEKAADELSSGLYGPRYCTHCKKIVQVRTYKLQGTDWVKTEGYTVKAGFIGSHVCDECLRPIEPKSPSEEK